MSLSNEAQFDFSELDELYREVILDHYRNPRNKTLVDEADIRREGFNPFCGDSVVLQFKLIDGNRIKEIGYQGEGCSISQASASMLTVLAKGKTLDEAYKVLELFRSVMHGTDLTVEALEQLGDLEALQGVRKFPVRIKCALLAWSTLGECIETFSGEIDNS